MSVTVPAILLQSRYWGAKRIETLAAFANGRPISGNMFDVILEEADWLACKTNMDAEQGPYVSEEKTSERQQLAAAAAKLHDQIREVVLAHRRVNEEKEKARKALEEERDERQRREMLEQHRANERRERERREEEERAKQRADAEREDQRRLKEEREKRRIEQERDAQRRLEEEREKDRKAEAEHLKGLERACTLKREKELSSEKDRKLDLSWLEDPEGVSRAAREQAMREADEISKPPTGREEEERRKAQLEREKRERRQREKAENERHKRLWEEMVRKKAQESQPAPANRAPHTPTARPTAAGPSSTTAPKAVLTPAKTTPAPTPASTKPPPKHVSAVHAPAPGPSATNAQSKSTLASSPASPTAPKSAPQLTLTVTPAAIAALKSNPAAVLIATPASISPQAEAGPSTSASSRVSTDWPRPYNSSMDPYPPVRRQPPASEPSAPHPPAPRPPAQAKSTELRTAEDVENAIGIAEETLVEHFEGLQDSAVALAISHDDMRRQIVSIEQKRKAERVTRDAQAAGLGIRVGKLEGTLHNLELVDQHRESLEGERAPEKQRLRRQKISDDIDINSVVLRFIDKMAGSKVEDLERRSTTQDERAKAYGSVVAQYSQRADALEAGLKEIMGTLEKRGMTLPEGGTAKRQRTA